MKTTTANVATTATATANLDQLVSLVGGVESLTLGEGKCGRTALVAVTATGRLFACYTLAAAAPPRRIDSVIRGWDVMEGDEERRDSLLAMLPDTRWHITLVGGTREDERHIEWRTPFTFNLGDVPEYLILPHFESAESYDAYLAASFALRQNPVPAFRKLFPQLKWEHAKVGRVHKVYAMHSGCGAIAPGQLV